MKSSGSNPESMTGLTVSIQVIKESTCGSPNETVVRLQEYKQALDDEGILNCFQ